jgi:SAM-dependent methyltransferase
VRNQDKVIGMPVHDELLPTCPACNARQVTSIGVIDTRVLIGNYQKFLGVQVADLFSGTRQIVEIRCLTCDLLFFSPAIAGDEQFYAELAKQPWYYMADKPEFSVAADLIARGSRVLEVGCGYGAFAGKLSSVDYTGLEFSSAAATQARKAGLEIHQQTVEEHAVTHAGNYDVACSFQVLEHTQAPRQFVENMARCVRSGGRLLLSVPSEDGFGSAVINDLLNLPPHHLTRWSDRALVDLGARLGLTLERLVPESVAHYHRGRFLSSWFASVLPLGLQGRPGRRMVTGVIRPQLWRVLAVASQTLARALPAAVQALADRTNARGHTVVAVFSKS